MKTSCEFNLYGFPAKNQNKITFLLNDFLQSRMVPKFEDDGYSIKMDQTLPLEKAKKLNPVYRQLRGYKTELKKGAYIGTKIEMTWSEAKLDKLQMKVSLDSNLLMLLTVVCSLVMTLIAYGLTVVFWEYWIIVVVTLFICFLLTFVMALLPLIIGILCGVGLAYVLNMIITSKENKQMNKEDREYIYSELKRYGDELVKQYKQGTIYER